MILNDYANNKITESEKDKLTIVNLFHDIIYDPTSSVNEEKSAEFFEVLNITTQGEVIHWRDDDAIGFTILLSYPHDKSFIPVKNRDGSDDSVVMVKIGYLIRDIREKGDTRLLVSVNKSSRYLLKDHFRYNFEDAESPSKSAVEASERSRQPIDLEEYEKFIYNINSKKIRNSKKNQNKKIKK